LKKATEDFPLHKIVGRENMEDFINQLEAESDEFCQEIANMKVDVMRARTAIMTEEKEVIINRNKTNSEQLFEAIDDNKLEEIIDTVVEYNDSVKVDELADIGKIESELVAGALTSKTKQWLYKAFVGGNPSSRKVAKAFEYRYGKPKSTRILGVPQKATIIKPLYKIIYE